MQMQNRFRDPRLSQCRRPSLAGGCTGTLGSKCSYWIRLDYIGNNRCSRVTVVLQVQAEKAHMLQRVQVEPVQTQQVNSSPRMHQDFR